VRKRDTGSWISRRVVVGKVRERRPASLDPDPEDPAPLVRHVGQHHLRAADVEPTRVARLESPPAPQSMRRDREVRGDMARRSSVAAEPGR